MWSLLALVAALGGVSGQTVSPGTDGPDPCNWLYDGYFFGSEITDFDESRIPFEMCYTPSVNMEDNSTWQSWMWTVEDHDDGNYTVTRWFWNDINCDNNDLKWEDCLYPDDHPSDGCDSNLTAVYTNDHWCEPETGCDDLFYFHLGGQDCHVRIQHYYEGQYEGDFDDTNLCQGLDTANANFTQSVYQLNENYTRNDVTEVIRCSKNATRVTIQGEPSPAWDTNPWVTYRYYENYEGGCYEISCAADNRTEDEDFDFEQPSEKKYISCKYINIWDTGETYAMGRCANAYQEDGDVYTKLDSFTYSYQFECNSDENAVYLYFYAYPNCRGQEYFGNYFTEDDADFSCDGRSSTSCYSTFTEYEDYNGCGGGIPDFDPHTYLDTVHATGGCHREGEIAEDEQSYFYECDSKTDTLKRYEWLNGNCTGTVHNYQEYRTGCYDDGGYYQQVTCGSTNPSSFTISASGRAIVSWSAAALVASLVWFSL